MTTRAALPLLFALLVISVAAFACTPEAPTSSVSAAPREAVAAPAEPAAKARQLLASAFAQTGEAERVTGLVFEGGLLKATLDLPIDTIGDADVYMRVCNRLATLISTDEEPSEVAGVQTFGPGGRSVVASGDAQTRCAKFYQ